MDFINVSSIIGMILVIIQNFWGRVAKSGVYDVHVFYRNDRTEISKCTSVQNKQPNKSSYPTKTTNEETFIGIRIWTKTVVKNLISSPFHSHINEAKTLPKRGCSKSSIALSCFAIPMQMVYHWTPWHPWWNLQTELHHRHLLAGKCLDTVRKRNILNNSVHLPKINTTRLFDFYHWM